MSYNRKPDFSNKYDMDSLIKKYYDDKIFDNYTNKELEVRFSSNGPKGITRMDYDNTIQKLLSLGFKSDNINGTYMLRIINEFRGEEGQEMLSNVRAELQGLNVIQDYCKYENISKIIEVHGPESVTFLQKKKVIDKDNYKIKPVFNNDFGFKIDYQLESSVSPNLSNKILDSWSQTKKIFRYINRIQFYHESLPILIDLSIVKSGEKSNRRPFNPIPYYSIDESRVFSSLENYEIEIEVDEKRIKDDYYDSYEKILGKLKIGIKYVLSALQGTDYPISNSEKTNVTSNYMTLIHGKKKEIPDKITPRNFIGPSSTTLQIKNIMENVEDYESPNIRNNYTVTDKADGERSLLFINESGKLYFIDSSMRVKFTGCVTSQKALYMSLIDGEYIEHDKNGLSINLFACFDIYYFKGEDKRSLPFVEQEIIAAEGDSKKTKSRLQLLRQFVVSLKIKSVTGSDFIPMRFEVKFFEIANENKNIFDCCESLLRRINDPSYEYETDGLIFTPGNMRLPESDYRVTWDYSFKWKPSKYNTIDFLIKTKKGQDNRDEINYLYSDGIDTSGQQDIKSYKTLILMCGFDESKNGYMNPCSYLIEGSVPTFNKQDKSNYKPLPFYPTNPYDDTAYLCNIMLRKDINGDLQMYSEEEDLIEDNTIVEFRYEMTNENNWKWLPLRVRYDKTYQYRSKLIRNFGNDYSVANSNWHSIHNPITEDMLKTGTGISEDLSDDDVYYRKSDTQSQTRRLRDFHNTYVKRKLIESVSNVDETLIDVAVGKAGDLPKWIKSKLSFVFGIDYSKDNIENKIDGACARYLNKKKDMRRLPDCMFIHGNSGKNIRTADAILSNEKYKTITKAIFGDGPKDESIIGKNIFKNYGIGREGFNITSCQFALHYFFESLPILQKFLQNVCECTKVNGYFIATCYDGRKLFNILEGKRLDESVIKIENEKKVWEVVKKYDYTEYKDDSSSVGYAIDVYQDSINKLAREYLVNDKYLIRIMENYGFRLLNENECHDLDLPSSTNYFETLFDKMNDELKNGAIDKKDLRSSTELKEYEKEISFLNRYFVFKKVRTVNASSVIIDDNYVSKTEEEVKLNEFLEEQEKTRKIKKLPYKLILKQIVEQIE